jgi:hypothetical protein
MSSPAASAPAPRRSWLPAWAAHRPEGERDPASRDVRAVETTIIALIGLLLAVAVVYDVVHQVKLNTRTTADRATWRAYEHVSDPKTRLDVRTPLRGTTDYVCRSTSTVAAVALHQVRLCLQVSGPNVNDRRRIEGGYYLAPHASDRAPYRYGCFGAPADESLCGAADVAAASKAWAAFKQQQ